jgi:hypothetical protein
MRWLCDESFPHLVQQQGFRDLELLRWSGEGLSNAELVREAARSGFSAVAVIGGRFLIDRGMLEASAVNRVPLIVMHEDEPMAAALLLSVHVQAIARRLDPERLLYVFTSEIRELLLKDLLDNLS